MKPIFLFRVEDSNGNGPYNDRIAGEWDQSGHLDQETHPNTAQDFTTENLIPYLEKSSKDGEDDALWLHACPSLEELYAWFGEYSRMDLKEICDCVLAVYQVFHEDCLMKSKSGKQVLFDKFNASNLFDLDLELDLDENKDLFEKELTKRKILV